MDRADPLSLTRKESGIHEMPDATAAARWRGPACCATTGHLPLARLPAMGNRPAHDPPAFDPVTVFSHLTRCRCRGILRG